MINDHFTIFLLNKECIPTLFPFRSHDSTFSFLITCRCNGMAGSLQKNRKKRRHHLKQAQSALLQIHHHTNTKAVKTFQLPCAFFCLTTVLCEGRKIIDAPIWFYDSVAAAYGKGFTDGIFAAGRSSDRSDAKPQHCSASAHERRWLAPDGAETEAEFHGKS